jgi:hypothetical protein
MKSHLEFCCKVQINSFKLSKNFLFIDVKNWYELTFVTYVAVSEARQKHTDTLYNVYQNDWSSMEVDNIHKYGEETHKY